MSPQLVKLVNLLSTILPRVLVLQYVMIATLTDVELLPYFMGFIVGVYIARHALLLITTIKALHTARAHGQQANLTLEGRDPPLWIEGPFATIVALLFATTGDHTMAGLFALGFFLNLLEYTLITRQQQPQPPAQ